MVELSKKSQKGAVAIKIPSFSLFESSMTLLMWLCLSQMFTIESAAAYALNCKVSHLTDISISGIYTMVLMFTAITPQYATTMGNWGIPEKNYTNVAQHC